jgi:hypothetical protein
MIEVSLSLCAGPSGDSSGSPKGAHHPAEAGPGQGGLAQTSAFEVCDGREGQPKSAAAPLARRPTGAFGRSQTPQSGVCASPPLEVKSQAARPFAYFFLS